MYQKLSFVLSVLLVFLMAAAPLSAKVSPEEAAKLKNELTPFGAERAGNAAGTIPEWNGGITGIPQGTTYIRGNRRVNPYADDKVVYAITAKNLSQHADKLNEGQKALFKSNPNTYRIDVYPTRRPFSAPEWVYENTYKNATRAELSPDGLTITGAYGGIPYPIPQNAAEVIQNNNLRFRGDAVYYTYTGFFVQPNGSITVGNGGQTWEQWPYYYKEGSLETFKGDYWLIFVDFTKPNRRKGELLLVREPVNIAASPRKAWQYLVGQRRVRRAPTVAFDTPNPAYGGTVTYDDYKLFNGSLERYDWELIGKKEMIVPYNNYEMNTRVDNPSEFYPGKHANPDHLRWEIHRVWVVRATLKSGKRHIYGKRMFYLDEDSWQILLSDSYDGRGNLWRTSVQPTYFAYEAQVLYDPGSLHYDLNRGCYGVNVPYALEEKVTIIGERMPENFFTLDNIRRFGKR